MNIQSYDNFKLWWDEKEGVMRGQIIGSQNEEDAKRMVNGVSEFVDSLNRKGISDIYALFDMNEAGSASAKARDILKDLVKSRIYRKIALYGGGVVQRVIAKYVFTIIESENVRYFAYEREALRWLKSKDPALFKNKYWREGDTLHYIIADKVGFREADRLKDGGFQMIQEIVKDMHHKAKVLIDIEKASTFSSKAKDNWIEFLRNKDILKTAIFGGSFVVRTIAAFVIKASAMANIQQFSSRKEALAWLKRG